MGKTGGLAPCVEAGPVQGAYLHRITVPQSAHACMSCTAGLCAAQPIKQCSPSKFSSINSRCSVSSFFAATGSSATLPGSPISVSLVEGVEKVHPSAYVEENQTCPVFKMSIQATPGARGLLPHGGNKPGPAIPPTTNAAASCYDPLEARLQGSLGTSHGIHMACRVASQRTSRAPGSPGGQACQGCLRPLPLIEAAPPPVASIVPTSPTTCSYQAPAPH